MKGKLSMFGIRICECKDNLVFDISEFKELYSFVSKKIFFEKNPIQIVADPFLFVKSDTLYLFYEEKLLYTPGVIKMICTRDLRTWSIPVVVLKENFHLSFPYVFEEKGSFYMIPETGEDNSVRLYKACNDDLSVWKLDKKLLSSKIETSVDINFADSCILCKEEVYYLFTSKMIDKEYCLELYHSSSLDGEYALHPQSPVCRGNKYARNAGSIISIEGKIYRVSQDCSFAYGANISVHEIMKLTPDTYQECLYKDDILSTDIYSNGGHQFNMAIFQGKTIIATDFKYSKWNLFNLLNRVKNKLLK